MAYRGLETGSREVVSHVIRQDKVRALGARCFRTPREQRDISQSDQLRGGPVPEFRTGNHTLQSWVCLPSFGQGAYPCASVPSSPDRPSALVAGSGLGDSAAFLAGSQLGVAC